MSKNMLVSVYDIETQQFIYDGIERSVVTGLYGINNHTLSQYITRGYKLKDRYVICRQDEKQAALDTLSAEDEVYKDNLSKADDFVDRWNDMLELFKPFKRESEAVR